MGPENEDDQDSLICHPAFHHSIGNAWNESQRKIPLDFREPKNFEV
jgi:hypothetical protein